VILLLCLVCISFAYESGPFFRMTANERRKVFNDYSFKHFLGFHSSEHYDERFKIFEANLQIIDDKNAQNTRAKFGLTPFSHLSPQEFKRYYLGMDATPIDPSAPVAPLASEATLRDLPSSFDWRGKGAVTPVKNQGQCGSCWAFSTTGNVEGQHFLATGKLVSLSEQNLVDCDHECMMYQGEESCDEGCNGGLQPNAYNYIISNNGIDTEASYPYEAIDQNCAFNKATVGATISNYTMISTNETQMAAYLVANGPIAIAADAVEWQFYIGGVFDGPCGTELDHGILITGFDEEIDDFGFKIKYWWVKNSWGSDWGLNGYMKIIRDVGECGLNLFVSSSIINK